jgi:predicted nucleic acid binding AN1-type Zn finger protein
MNLKKNCSFNKCFTKASVTIGYCRYCTLKYCSKHRLPESHVCDGIESCHLESFEKIKFKLTSEKTIGSRVERV